MAGLLVGRGLGCSGCLGVGSGVPATHVPGHPTSIRDEVIKVEADRLEWFSSVNRSTYKLENMVLCFHLPYCL